MRGANQDASQLPNQELVRTGYWCASVVGSPHITSNRRTERKPHCQRCAGFFTCATCLRVAGARRQIAGAQKGGLQLALYAFARVGTRV